MSTPENKNIGSDLDRTFDTFVQAMSMEIAMEYLDDVVARDITGFGTTIDERIFGLEECRKLIENQKLHSENAEFTFEQHTSRKRLLAGGRAALFVLEGEIRLVFPEASIQFPLRISTVLDKMDEDWKVVHWHASTPVMSEDDTWHVNDWQKKNEELERKVAEKTAELEASLRELKATQNQLIVQEKLAALGQLAAGIAHEIKNPMNFVNNFAELSLEYIDEIRELVKTQGIASQQGIASPSQQIITELLDDVQANLQKIHQHGTRADSIVKSMLMHSRGGSGVLEATDLNELIREYVNLAFHGMRAGKDPINVKINLDLDENIGMVPLFPEDFSRVILNLCKNAFDAMRDKTRLSQQGNYLPTLNITSKANGNRLHLTFEDNGPGISEENRRKLFEPFFTTKKGTEGTGLGLSITHDIIAKHQGSIDITSETGQFARFTVELPLTQQD